MRAFLMVYVYVSDFDGHGASVDHRSPIPAMSRRSESQAFILLASVCSYWHQTLVGWPQSGTRYWLRHKLRKLIECEYICLISGGSRN